MFGPESVEETGISLTVKVGAMMSFRLLAKSASQRTLTASLFKPSMDPTLRRKRASAYLKLWQRSMPSYR